MPRAKLMSLTFELPTVALIAVIICAHCNAHAVCFAVCVKTTSVAYASITILCTLFVCARCGTNVIYVCVADTAYVIYAHVARYV